MAVVDGDSSSVFFVLLIWDLNEGEIQLVKISPSTYITVVLQFSCTG